MCGFAKGVRTLIGVGHYTAVLVRQYRCDGCSEAAKEGKKSRMFTALHPGVLKQCQPAYRQSIPFRVFPRLLIDICMLDMLNSLRISGTSFAAFSRASRWSLETAHYRRWLVHDHQLVWARSTLMFGDAPVNLASSRFRRFKGKFIGPKLAKRIYMEDFYRRRISTLTYLGTFVGDVVKVDYTYWATKFVREGAKMVAKAQFGMVSETAPMPSNPCLRRLLSCFVVLFASQMNGVGCILGTVFTKTKETVADPAVNHLMRTFRRRCDVYGCKGPLFGWSDSAKKDEPFFQSWFPE